MPVDADALARLVTGTLEDCKAQRITVLDVHALADFTDVMVIASGRSTRQVKAKPPSKSSSDRKPRAAGRSASKDCARANGCSSISATSCCTS